MAFETDEISTSSLRLHTYMNLKLLIIYSIHIKLDTTQACLSAKNTLSDETSLVFTFLVLGSELVSLSGRLRGLFVRRKFDILLSNIKIILLLFFIIGF